MSLEIIIEPWKRLVIHEVIEHQFDDFVQMIASQNRAIGGGIPTISWANGIVFQWGALPDTESVIQEKLKGTLHWGSVIFAIKEKFEKQIMRENVTINFNDVGVNEIFAKVAETLRTQSKFKST